MARFPFSFSIMENGTCLYPDVECDIDVQHEYGNGLVASDVYINDMNLFDPLASTFAKQLGSIALEYAQDELDREGPLFKRAADSFEEDMEDARERDDEARAEAKMERWAERELY